LLQSQHFGYAFVSRPQRIFGHMRPRPPSSARSKCWDFVTEKSFVMVSVAFLFFGRRIFLIPYGTFA
ncbi:MAG: hypothetical protein Q8Q94_01475, partial [bacterium]|nr:hypothetical protein [bacterium]